MAPDRIIEDPGIFGESDRYKIVDGEEVIDLRYPGGKSVGTIESYFGGGFDFVNNDGTRTHLDERALDGRLSDFESVREISRAVNAQGDVPSSTVNVQSSSSSDYSSDYGSYQSAGKRDYPETFWGWVLYIVFMAISWIILLNMILYFIFFPLGLGMTVALAGLVFAAVMYSYEFVVWLLSNYGELIFWFSATGFVLWFAVWGWTPSRSKKPQKGQVKKMG